LVLGHKRLVGLVWLAVLIPAVLATPKVSDRLSQQFALPGQPGYEANQRIVRTYGNGGYQLALVPVIGLPRGVTVDQPAARQALGRAIEALGRQPGMRVASYLSTGDRRFVGADGRTTFALVFIPPQPILGGPDLGPPITRTLAGNLPEGWTVRVTGLSQLELGSDTTGPTVLTETLLGALGALAVLAFVFGSLLALVPLLVAAVSILTTFLIIFGLTELTEISFFTQFLVALIGLGVAIDYSLLLVTRWREELAGGHTGDQAVQRAMVTAGRAVALSGLTVAVGLVSMVSLPVPFLRSLGYAGLLIPLVSVLVTVTLLPVLLATAGRRLDWPRRRKEAHVGRGWSAWARAVVRARWVAVLAALAVLVPLGVAAFDLQLGTPRADALAKSGPAYEGLVMLERAGIPSGVLTTLEVLVPAGADPAQVASRLAGVAGVRAAVAPDDPAWRRGGTAVVSVQPLAETGTPEGKRTMTRVREAAAVMPGIQVGGRGAEDVDFTEAVYGRFPVLLSVIVAVSFVLLARAFRSLLLPLKAVVLNLLSVGAIYGVLVLVWQDGHGSGLFGVPPSGAVEVFIPLLVFAYLYGLSMDYEVFIVARMREAQDRTGSTTQAVVEGIGRTGRLVTSAALILLLAFASLASGPIVTVKVFATGLGAGILLDATVVRALLLPATVSLFGRWNWWLPTWAARLLRVQASPARRDHDLIGPTEPTEVPS
jgi:RND superfamily putative drug exporter